MNNKKSELLIVRMEALDLKWRSELAKCKLDEVAVAEANLCAIEDQQEAEVALAEVREAIRANRKCVFEGSATFVGKEFIGRLEITEKKVEMVASKIENRIELTKVI